MSMDLRNVNHILLLLCDWVRPTPSCGVCLSVRHVRESCRNE